MGSATSESCRDTNETRHQVTLTHSFEIGETEVTVTQFIALRGYVPSPTLACSVTSCPVQNLTWHEAIGYCNALSKSAGLVECYTCQSPGLQTINNCVYALFAGPIYYCPGYRLPTEAEWEYAVRAGTTTSLHNGTYVAKANCTGPEPNLDPIAWYVDNSFNQTHPVKLKQSNAWGLRDMSGNVSEWTADGYVLDLGPAAVTDPWAVSGGATIAVRGGAFSSFAKDLRSASRTAASPTAKAAQIGFRCARTLTP